VGIKPTILDSRIIMEVEGYGLKKIFFAPP
jgi:hypothetical protein